MLENQNVSREYRAKQIWAVRFRFWILVGLAMLYTALVAAGGAVFQAYALASLLPLFTVNELRRFCHRRGIHNDLLTEATIFLDLATIGIIVHFTGGVESIFTPFLFIQVAGTALHVNFKAGLKSAAGAACLFIAICWVECAGVLPHTPFMSDVGHATHCLNRWYVTSASLLTAFGLLLASFSSGYVAKRLRVREDELAEANKQLVRLYRETQRLSITDELTGAFNRRHLAKRLTEELTRCTRYERPFSLLILDVDFFKKVNDTFGHPVGDVVLKEVSSRVSRELRESDFFARYGGEEFVVLLPETPIDGARLVAERIRERIAGQPIPVDALELDVTVSMGVSAWTMGRRDHADGGSELLALADARLYRAKKAGRNRVVSTDQPQMNPAQPADAASFAAGARATLAHA